MFLRIIVIATFITNQAVSTLEEMEYDIVTFGSAVVDTFIDTEFNEKTKSFNYPAGAKILAHNIRSDIGGGATNTAVAFARLGLKTGCVCKIGDDKDGKEILTLFRKENIRFFGSTAKTKQTGHSVILDSKDKNRTILTYKGPGNNIGLKELIPFQSNWLYYTGVIGRSFSTQLRLARKMVSSGTKLAFNPGYIDSKNDLRPLIKITHILIINKEEALTICKKYKKKGDLLEALRSLGPEIVVVTNKDKLVYAYDGKSKYSIKPNVVRVVERTGAGDAFASGFVAGFIAKKSIQECLELGLEESESVIRHFGAKNKLIKRRLK